MVQLGSARGDRLDVRYPLQVREPCGVERNRDTRRGAAVPGTCGGSLRRSDSIRNSYSAGSKIPNCGSAKPQIRALKAQPPGTEFLDAETGRQNSCQNARTPGETKIREMSGRKSRQKRPIWRRIGNVRFAETGWWCAQSHANPSPCYLANIRVIFENNSEPAAGNSKNTCGTGISLIFR